MVLWSRSVSAAFQLVLKPCQLEWDAMASPRIFSWQLTTHKFKSYTSSRHWILCQAFNHNNRQLRCVVAKQTRGCCQVYTWKCGICRCRQEKSCKPAQFDYCSVGFVRKYHRSAPAAAARLQNSFNFAKVIFSRAKKKALNLYTQISVYSVFDFLFPC